MNDALIHALADTTRRKMVEASYPCPHCGEQIDISTLREMVAALDYLFDPERI